MNGFKVTEQWRRAHERYVFFPNKENVILRVKHRDSIIRRTERHRNVKI